MRVLSDKHRSVIVKIACGINEFTRFDYHNEGKDLGLRSDVSNSRVLDDLKRFKQKVKSEIPTAVVGYVTVCSEFFCQEIQRQVQRTNQRLKEEKK